MIESISDILLKAKEGKYGVAAPDVYNGISVRVCFEIAAKLNAPLILSCLGKTNMEEVAAVTRFYERKYPHAVVALHLDHGGSFEEIMLALRYGYSSVMIDRSTLPFDKNVAEVKEVVKIAHAMGVPVEAELGHVGSGINYETTRDSGLTKKEEAKRFIEETNVDCLAVAVGTSHGVYKGTPKLEFGLLQDISKLVDVPLVLHGGSGTGDENLKKAIACGIQKVNIFTDLATPAADGMQAFMGKDCNDPEIIDAIKPFKGRKKDFLNAPLAGGEVYKVKLAHYVKLFGSVNKA